jgi:hypothetical protein
VAEGWRFVCGVWEIDTELFWVVGVDGGDSHAMLYLPTTMKRS